MDDSRKNPLVTTRKLPGFGRNVIPFCMNAVDTHKVSLNQDPRY